MNTITQTLKKHLFHGIFISMLAILLLRVGGANAAALALSCGQWTITPAPGQGILHAVTVVPGKSNNVWSVGFSNSGGLVEHWNGKKWHLVSNPYTSSLLTVAAVSAKDIWAAGHTGSIMHWNGKVWSMVPSPSNVLDLYGLAAISTTDAWAVGEGNNSTPIIEHWNGTAWSIFSSPNTSGGLVGIAAISANDIWALGRGPSGTLTEHWDGTQWSIIPSVNPSGWCEVFPSAITAISASDVWVVGAYDTACQSPYFTYTEHWDGTRWSIIPSPNPGHSSTTSEFYGVAAAATNNVWAVGFTTANSGAVLTEHWDGTQWSIVSSPGTGQSPELDGIAATSAGNFWAVGTGNGQPLTEFYC